MEIQQKSGAWILIGFGCLPLLIILGGLGGLIAMVASGPSCTPTTSLVVDEDELPSVVRGRSHWNSEQIVNAAIIINVGADLGLPITDQTIAVMTAMGESSLEVKAYGDFEGPDSLGLFQQRDNDAWDTHDRMDPVGSATMFYEALQQVEDRTISATSPDADASTIAHTVQRNADRWHYMPYWWDAELMVEMLANSAADAVIAESIECTDTGGGGVPQISMDCDPVRSGGLLQESSCGIYAALVSEWGTFWHPEGGVGCIRDEPGSDHHTGHACDYMVAKPGTHPTSNDHRRAVQVVQWLMDNHETLNVKYIIYDEAIWTVGIDEHGPWEQVKRNDVQYGRLHFLNSGSCEWRRAQGGDAGVQACAITMAHIDHIHISSN